MPKENGPGDHDDEKKRDDGDEEPDWVEKHLVKIIALVGILCAIGLTGRALTG